MSRTIDAGVTDKTIRCLNHSLQSSSSRTSAFAHEDGMSEGVPASINSLVRARARALVAAVNDIFAAESQELWII